MTLVWDDYKGGGIRWSLPETMLENYSQPLSTTEDALCKKCYQNG